MVLFVLPLSCEGVLPASSASAFLPSTTSIVFSTYSPLSALLITTSTFLPGKEIPSEYAEYYHIPEGVFVEEATEGAPAQKAGIQKGDILHIQKEFLCQAQYQDRLPHPQKLLLHQLYF